MNLGNTKKSWASTPHRAEARSGAGNNYLPNKLATRSSKAAIEATMDTSTSM